MTSSRRPLAVLLLLALGALLCGCQTQGPADSSIPWGRPANWEGQIPGMGSGQGAPTH